MSLSLNASDPLYGNIVALFAVDGTTVVELKNATSLTVDAAVLLPNSSPTPSTTEPYGNSFHTTDAAGSPFGFKGITFAQIAAPTNAPQTVFVVFNKVNSVGGSGEMFGSSGSYVPGMQANSTKNWKPQGSVAGSTGSGVYTTTSFAAGGHSIAYTRTGSDAANAIFAYTDGVLDAGYPGGQSNAGGQYGFGSSSAGINAIGGDPGQGHCALDYVFVVFFNSVLSGSDIARLHSSLTGGGAFALISAPPAGTTISTTTGNAVAAGITAAVPQPSVIHTTAGAAAAAGTLAGVTSTATVVFTDPLSNRTGTRLANESGVTINFYDVATGALVLRKTGLTTDANGLLPSVSDPAFSSGASYAWEVVLQTHGRRLPVITVA